MTQISIDKPMMISIICPGTALRIELNGLKMNQLLGISRLILRSILILDYTDIFVMMLDVDAWYGTGDTIMGRYQKWVVSSFYMLPHTGKKKTNSSFILYLFWDWSERHPMKVEIPHKVMCGQKKNSNDIPTYVKMMIRTRRSDDMYSNMRSKWWSNCPQMGFCRHNVHIRKQFDHRNKFCEIILPHTPK